MFQKYSELSLHVFGHMETVPTGGGGGGQTVVYTQCINYNEPMDFKNFKKNQTKKLETSVKCL